MKDSEKTEIILNQLIIRYTTWGKDRNSVIFPELRLGSGYCGVAQRRVDFFVISSSAGNETTAFEIKVSRQDFQHDLDNDLKQRGARLYSNKFIYVTPKGLLSKEEVPVWAGLWEIDINSKEALENNSIREIIPAPLHSRVQPSWGLICSIVRKINKEKLAYGENVEKDEEIRRLKARVAELEKLNIDKWTPKRIRRK